jgi:two-component system, NtrC family, C4-dicarboxylate transport response regulator DctD
VAGDQEMRHFDRLISHANVRQQSTEPLIAGNSVAAHAMRQMVTLCADTTNALLISGPDATARLAIAKAVHAQSQDADTLFIEVDCCNATQDHFAVRWDGTLLLDNIGALELSCQIALLNWVESEDGQNVRLIAGTEISIVAFAQAEQLITPLLKKFSSLALPCPALAQRKADIPIILQRIWAVDHSSIPPIFDRTAWSALHQHGWDGDYSELMAFARLASLRFAGEHIDDEDVWSLLDGQ